MGGAPGSILAQSKSALRRHLLLSSGISSMALGLALIVSFLAAAYGETAVQRLAVAEGSSFQVVAHNERETSRLLDRAGAPAAAAQPTPETTPFAAAVPAAPFQVQAAPSPTPTTVPQPSVPAQLPPKRAGEPVKLGRIDNVNLTFYDCQDQGFCGRMSSGAKVYAGAAACSWNLPQGTRLVIVDDPTGRVYVCEDRGLLEDTWVDVFFHDPDDGWAWQKSVGRYGSIEVISLP